MKPIAKTLFRRMRDTDGMGNACWLRAGELDQGSDPVLAYSWGRTLRFLRVKDGDTPTFVDGQRWDAPDDIRALQWYDANHLLVHAMSLILLDVRTMTQVETMPLDTQLVSFPSIRGLCVSNSLRTYRGKLVLLSHSQLLVGTLSHWNDRVLAKVHQGDFLGAIHLAVDYFEGRSTGNRIGLPGSEDAAKKVVSSRIRELIHASLAWAFSEERMHDDTHFSPDGRGVDLTSLFESLAIACIDACLSIGDRNTLFNLAYERYAEAGIHGIFLRQLEPYILDGRLIHAPPEVVKNLVSLHAEAFEWEQAEAIIWHVDPHSLDIDQAITICEEHQLWDALVHVYTRALHDYIAPLQKLAPEQLFEYIEYTLCGCSYPDGAQLPADESDAARKSVYEWISSNLPQLLHLDTEAFLHTLDIAFEDSYLDDSSDITRQTLINQMLDVMDSSDFNVNDVTLLHIFVARNLPKYSQFLLFPPSVLQRILFALCTDNEPESREDRQLAAEFLLSAFTPQNADAMLQLYESAGFYRILAIIYRREQRWGDLIATIVKLHPEDIFAELDSLVEKSPTTVEKVIPDLLNVSITSTATLLQKVPQLHPIALSVLPPHKQIAYLSSLDQLKLPLRHQYINLLTVHEPSSVIGYMDSHGKDKFDLFQLNQDFQTARFPEGQAWALDRQGKPGEALTVIESVLREEGMDIGQAVVSGDLGTVHMALQSITSACVMGTRLCRERSSEAQAEDMWFGILNEMVELVQSLSSLSVRASEGGSIAVDTLRQLIQDTLSALVSSRSPSLSFPRLFKRLVDSTPTTKRSYAEFRSILSGMLDSYRTEGEMLTMTTRLLEGDLFVSVHELVVKRQAGWRPFDGFCDECGLKLEGDVMLSPERAYHRSCQKITIPS
ncbi:hypothetical protein TREMEDRAFT_40588 [Tremella mesenterica DSM 1558]|nr:uncharacterized protein TREMEDRAFT_40588 [Tremella mesenterica DSM 1558]EIW66894.1 hypothetical protein TREMEDRAFT_40588 [Tremella mesenterica DSM 1558]